MLTFYSIYVEAKCIVVFVEFDVNLQNVFQ